MIHHGPEYGAQQVASPGQLASSSQSHGVVNLSYPHQGCQVDFSKILENYWFSTAIYTTELYFTTVTIFVGTNV